MRRKKREGLTEKDNFKTLILLAGGVLAIAIITFAVTYMIYSNKVKSNEGSDILGAEQMVGMVPNNSSNAINVELTSSEIGKSINEVKNEQSNQTKDVANQNNIVSKNEIVNNTVNNTTSKSSNMNQSTTNNIKVNKTTEEKKEEKPKDPTFIKPVEGDIQVTYAKDNLIYSETLQEWVTHLGIDIKAEKSTVVKAAAEGKIESIKNDPRYGLTITILHANGFKTVYSNLLTTEFVVEGENVKSGQTIGTVGNTAAFEVADAPHLHFEIIKDSEKIDPTAYIK